MDWLISVSMGWVPTWVWIVAAGIGLGWAWKVFGWQGVVGGLAAVVTLGAYRQGWRDGRGPIGQRHPVTGDPVVGVENPPPRRRRTVMDILQGR